MAYAQSLYARPSSSRTKRQRKKPGQPGSGRPLDRAATRHRIMVSRRRFHKPHQRRSNLFNRPSCWTCLHYDDHVRITRGHCPMLLYFKQRGPYLAASIKLCRKVLSCVIRRIALFWRSPRLCRHKTTSLFTTPRPDRKPMTHFLPPLLTPSLLPLRVAGLTP